MAYKSKQSPVLVAKKRAAIKQLKTKISRIKKTLPKKRKVKSGGLLSWL